MPGLARDFSPPHGLHSSRGQDLRLRALLLWLGHPPEVLTDGKLLPPALLDTLSQQRPAFFAEDTPGRPRLLQPWPPPFF